MTASARARARQNKTGPLRATITELAEEFHIARSVALRHLQDAGVPRDTKDLTFAYAAAAEAIRIRLDEAKITGHRNAGRASNGASLDDEARRALNASKAEAEQMRARKLRLEVERKEGNLVERSAVEKAGLHVIVAARTAFLALGAKVAPRLLHLADERQIAKIIEDEARIALGALSDIEAFLDEVL